MEAEARYTYVGAAVLALVAALVAGIFWLKGVAGEGNFDHYAIYFEEQALDGLEVGGEVSLRGIKVGRVVDYRLSDDKLNRVRVEVRVDKRVPVRTNTVAVVTRNFVTGIAGIALVNRLPAGPPLTEVPPGDALPVIAEGQSDLDEITGRVNQVGELASSALTNVNHMLSPDNRREAMEAVRGLRDLTAGLSQRLVALDRTLASTRTAATALGAAATHLGESGERVARVAEGTGERLAATMSQADLALADARGAMGRVASTLDRMERQAGSTAQRMEATAAQVDDALSATTAELRLSLEATSRVLDRLRDPRAALLGPGPAQLGPGEVLP